MLVDIDLSPETSGQAEPADDHKTEPKSAAAPLRIVHVCRQYRPGIGGIESVVEALAARQRRQGHEVVVVTLDRLLAERNVRLPARETIDDVRVERVPFFGSRRYPLAFGVLRRIRGASVVHVHGIDFFFDFLAWTRPLHRRPLVATTHGGFFHTEFAGGLKRLWFATMTRLSARAYGALIACSRQDAKRFAAIARDRLVQIENGVELARFGRIEDRYRDEMIYIGRFAPNKALPELLDWFAAVRAAAPGWRLTLAGQPDGIDTAEVRGWIERRGLGDVVRVVETPSPAELAALVRRASVFVSASTFEGFGLAPIEAAAAGLFPVLRTIPPFARTVERLGLGCLTDFDPTTVAPTLGAINAWRREGKEARLDGFGWDGAAEAHMRLYERRLGLLTRRIGAVDVTVARGDDVLDRIDRHVRGRERMTVAFCNAHTVNMARREPRFAEAMRSALVLNDGIGVDIASRWLFGRPFPENLNGTDLTPRLLDESPTPLRIFLLGGEPGVATDAALGLERAYPRHRIVGAEHGFFNDREEGAVIARIRAAQPDLILIGMGHPRQEMWAAAHAAQLPGVTMCVGAFLDRAAGRVPRAPGWVRALRCEWAYRLAREPRRLARRYLLGNLSFLASVFRQKRAGMGVTA